MKREILYIAAALIATACAKDVIVPNEDIIPSTPQITIPEGAT
jgi:hypothetical protein